MQVHARWRVGRTIGNAGSFAPFVHAASVARRARLRSHWLHVSVLPFRSKAFVPGIRSITDVHSGNR
jgi:hypothetical protein